MAAIIRGAAKSYDPLRSRSPGGHRRATALVIATLAVLWVGLVPTSTQAEPVAAGRAAVDPPPNSYVPLPPTRLLDTRESGGRGPLTSQETRNLTVVGAAGVPAGGVDAVVVNITALGASAATHLTAWPSNHIKPDTSNLNVAPGGTVSNLAVVGLFTSGLPLVSRSATQISLFNNAGTVEVIVDVVGYYSLPTGSTDPIYIAPDPVLRVADTRTTTPLGAGETRAIAVPASAYSTLAINVTATDVTAATHLTVWATGDAQPPTSNLNLAASETRAGLVLVHDVSGFVNVRNNAGTADVVIDLVGLVQAPPYQPFGPTRLYDSRAAGVAPARLGPGEVRNVKIAGVHGLPSTGITAVVLNVTVVGPSVASHLTVWRSGAPQPSTSNVNVAPGRTVANAVLVDLGESAGSPGSINVRNNSGTTDLVVDALGYYDGPAA